MPVDVKRINRYTEITILLRRLRLAALVRRYPLHIRDPIFMKAGCTF